LESPGLSLLDLTEGQRLFEWYAVYHWREPYYQWSKLFKQGFRHVELWRPEYYGPGINDLIWLVLRPTFEILESQIDLDPTAPWLRFPRCTVQKVQVISEKYKMRQWFHIGPLSCVETVKNALGINSFWIRTPYQLYKYIKRRDGVLGV